MAQRRLSTWASANFYSIHNLSRVSYFQLVPGLRIVWWVSVWDCTCSGITFVWWICWLAIRQKSQVSKTTIRLPHYAIQQHLYSFRKLSVIWLLGCIWEWYKYSKNIKKQWAFAWYYSNQPLWCLWADFHLLDNQYIWQLQMFDFHYNTQMLISRD